jgi:hypothetical protein
VSRHAALYGRLVTLVRPDPAAGPVPPVLPGPGPDRSAPPPTPGTARPAGRRRDLGRLGRRRDLTAAAAAVLLVLLAGAVGQVLRAHRVGIFLGAPPLFGEWSAHLGPGTPVALLIAVLTVTTGPSLAARLRWRWLLAATYVAGLAWILALAMVDGWGTGLAGRLATKDEYLHDVGRVTDVGAALRGFAARIPDFQPDSWTTHVAGHPPGALLVFVGLDRLGLSGGGPAALLCVLAGAGAGVAVLVTVRALAGAAGERLARGAAPFLVLLPGAVWLGVSADALFAGVSAAGIAAFALACTGRGQRADLAAAAAGLLLGASIFLSYGLVLLALPVLAIAVVTRRVRPLLITGAGVAVVVTAFAQAGFWWPDGYRLVRVRYYQGIGAQRPYVYFVWADLAALVLAVGPATAAGLRRVLSAPAGGPSLRARARARLAGGVPDVIGVIGGPGRGAGVAGWGPGVRWRAVVASVAVVVAAADLSGLSKAEVERIWLPFAVWLAASCALLPARHRRWWLAAQAATALLVQHLVATGW